MKKFNYIYLITNQINQKIYIGKHSTDSLDDGYMGSGKLIKKAIQKYGIENFTKDYLAFCDTEETLNYLEKFYIKKYKAKEVGYNLTDGGEGILNPTAETRKKIGLSRKGKRHTEESKQKMSEAKKGKCPSEETKQKMSESRRGPRNGMYKSTRFNGMNNPMYGVHRFGKDAPNYGKKQPKYKWQTPSGEIIIMDMANAHKHHPDWIKIGEA